MSSRISNIRTHNNISPLTLNVNDIILPNLLQSIQILGYLLSDNGLE